MSPFVLVTGGCGFVGRHLVLRLLENDARVVVVDDLSTGLDPNSWIPSSHRGRITFAAMDVRRFLLLHLDPLSWRQHFKDAHPPEFSHVYHLAAVVGGRAKIERDPIAVAQDLAIDADFFAWAVQARPGRILYASSSAAYPVGLQGEHGAVALKEEFAVFGGNLGQPDLTYGWAKLTGEYLASIAVKHYGLRIACVRPFSGYGEDQDPSYPVPAIAERVARREDPLTIWGAGDQGRDFVHIEDCIDAMLLAIERIGDGSAVNIGSGRLTAFKDVAQLLAVIAGYSPRIQPLLDKPVGVSKRYADTTRSKELLEWSPRISLEDGLRRVYEVRTKRLAAETAHR